MGKIVEKQSVGVFRNQKHRFRFTPDVVWKNCTCLFFHTGTCRCPPLVSSNFYLLSPYLTKTSDNTLQGVFGEILDDAVKFACGTCKTPNGVVSTVLDKTRNGRGSFAEKTSELKTINEVDEFTDLSFPIIGNLIRRKDVSLYRVYQQ